MKKTFSKRMLVISCILFFILSSGIPALNIEQTINDKNYTKDESDKKITSISTINNIEINLSFSYPKVVEYRNYSIVRVEETNHNQILMFNYDPGKPVLPVNISIFKLPFKTKILDVQYINSSPEIIELPNKIIFAKASYDTSNVPAINTMDVSIYESNDPYPTNWVKYHTGGGLTVDQSYKSKRTTFLILRIYPVRYIPNEDSLEFIQHINVNITYQTPSESEFESEEKNLLIITPNHFSRYLKPLVKHKEKHGIKTKLVTLKEINHQMSDQGRDEPEKIKYYIKHAIEEYGVEHVLLIGGIKRQSLSWNTPIRYSYVVPTEEQEYPEKRFISDLYYADIYDGEGNFSSWDSNDDNRFSVWNESFKEKMDLYPDVYLGRLPCRSITEVKTMVDKIINYEKERVAEKSWFKNLLLVGGDSYVTRNETWGEGKIVVEGELACNESINRMQHFNPNPIKVYASDKDINRRTVNQALNQGASFAYFCGHGSAATWNTHFPPANKTNWCSGYHVADMIPLRNQEKLPVTVVGGCHNGEFDRSFFKNIKEGLEKYDKINLTNFVQFIKRFLFDGWIPNCWAWWLTSKPNGGAIACIANTGLGTHGDGDQDNNSVVDYLEILDGWLELRFLELFEEDTMDVLGENHAITLNEYLHRFLDDGAKMDVKMVQQWQLFGDPSLKIGGYNK